MTQLTVKTPYYFELLAEVKGNSKKNFSAHNKFGAQSISTKKMSPEIQPSTNKFKKGSRIYVMISNFFKRLLLVFTKKVSNSFPLVKVCFKNGGLAGRDFYIYNINPPGNPAGYIKIGRENTQREKFFITVSQKTVSRTHVKIVFFNEELFVVNYSKVNPTRIGGQKIPYNRTVHLPEGAIVSLGGVELTVEKINS